MKAQVKESTLSQEISQTTTTATPQGPGVGEMAGEYARLKVQFDLIEGELKRLSDRLKAELPKVAGEEVRVSYVDAKGNPVDRALYLCHAESESFDLVALKEHVDAKSSLFKTIRPFIKVTESFDLKAARNLIDLKPLRKYIEVKKSVSLRFRD